MCLFDADIVAINETWLRKGEEQRAPNVPGYRLRNAPRPVCMRSGRGGGVAFYVKQGVRARLVAHPAAHIEQMWLSFTINARSFIIGTAYRPNWISVDVFLDALTESLTHFSNHDYVILLGDFNINMLESNEKSMKLNNFLNYMELKQVVREPTHFSVQNETLIDVVCTNASVREIFVSNITGSLGHAMVNVTFSIKRMKIPPKTIIFRPLKNMDIENFNKDMTTVDWESVLGLDSVEDMVSTFNKLLISLFDRHAPLKTIRIKPNNSLPWITETIKVMIGKRNKAYNKYRKLKSETSREYYNELKKLVIKSIRNEKRAYFNHHVNLIYKDSKTLWNNLRNTILTDSNRYGQLPDHLLNANDINDNFLDVPGSETIILSEKDFFDSQKFCDATFSLKPVGEDDISKYILSITTNAVGGDGIGRDMILMTLPRTVSIITHIINRSILTGEVPIVWKSAVVTPLPKADNPIEFKDLRPVSILPFLSKVLEKAVYLQLCKYVEAHNVLPSYQSGFRKGMGTVTALLDVVDNILSEQDSGNGTCLVLLDFSRAFDSIIIPLLLSKLSYYGVHQTSLAWFNSYLQNRSQCVKITKEDGTFLMSDIKSVNRGVPQGTILGPLLFIIYSADLIKSIKHCRYHLYADDVQLYISANPRDFMSTVSKINDDLSNVAQWANKNGLVLNPNKSKYVILGSKHQISKILNIDPLLNICGQSIERVEEARNLGIWLDSRLRFEKHVTNLVRSCFYRLKVLYRIRHFLSEKIRIMLCESLILSRLNYGDLIYGPRMLSKTRRLIQRVQNACCRFCYTIPPRSRITPYLNKASNLNMSSRRHFHLASLLFDVIKTKKPDYLFSKLKVSSFHNRYGTRNTRCELVGYSHRTTAFAGSFRYLSTKCWNNIPPPIRNLSSKYSFKIRFKQSLIEKQTVGIPHGWSVADFIV